MKIRSITYFCNPKFPLEDKILQQAGTFLAEAKSAYEAGGYEVQTVRIATTPFPKLLGEENIDKLAELTVNIDRVAQELNIEYVSLGPALPEMPRSFEVILDAVFVSKNVFFGGVMADKTRGLDHFGGHVLAPAPPRLLLVAPALEFHSTTETILSYLCPRIQVERIGLGMNWRRELQVAFRAAGSRRPGLAGGVRPRD